MRNVSARRWLGCAGVLASLLPAMAWAASHPPGEESQGEPGDLPVIPVPQQPEAVPAGRQFEWLVDGLAQGDFLATSNLPQDQTKVAKLRRARLAALARWRVDWRFEASADFANAPYLRSASVEYRGWPVAIEAGRIVEPFGVLSGSSTTMGLMERPMAEGLAPGYGLGLAGNANGERWGLTLGVYGSTPNNVQEGGREERAVTIRPTFAPLHKENQVIHLGVEASWRQSKGGTLQFVAIPESVLLYGMNVHSSVLFNNTQQSGHNTYQLYGAEMGMLFGPVLILTEGTLAHVDNAVTLGGFGGFPGVSSSADFTGYYLEMDWAMTRERRDYSVRRGAFSGIDPDRPVTSGGSGAFELALRVGGIDLQDPNLGGETGVSASLGLNWFPEEHTRVTLEGLDVERSSVAQTDHATAVQLRFQAEFSAP